MDRLAAVISVDSTKIRILHRYRLLNIRFRLVSSRLILEARVKLNENKTTNKQTKVVNKMIAQITDLSQFSLLLSSVFEKLVCNQLYEYLDENKHLFSHQSGLADYNP